MFKSISFILLTFFAPLSCSTVKKEAQPTHDKNNPTTIKNIPEGYETAYFASGCFWCVEAIFESVEGVVEAISGYAGGTAETAVYELVARGGTKHSEAVEVIYDPKKVSYETLVIVFFGSHDPTTLNRQGPDRGYQYRSALYYKNEEEKKIAEKIKAQLEKDKVYDDPIVTDITSFTTFFEAEPYHQNYERRNPNQPYVKAVSIPRLNRFKAKFPELLKKEKQGSH